MKRGKNYPHWEKMTEREWEGVGGSGMVWEGVGGSRREWESVVGVYGWKSGVFVCLCV